MISISVGICAYNEEKNIGRLLRALLNQETNKIRIKEIIVISSGSTDRTNEIVREFTKLDQRIRLITQPKRMGKASAVNEFLKNAEGDVCVLESADTVPAKNALEKLCIPFRDKTVGLTGGRPIPTNDRNSFIGFAGHLIWELHHRISLKNPKFGEFIAFRNIIDRIPEKTAVDEAWIEALIKKKGYRVVYVPEAICYNTAPQNLRDFIKQRRRIYYGHLHLKKEMRYEVSTVNLKNIIDALKGMNLKPKEWIYLGGAVFLEGISRFLGFLDYLLKRDHFIWDIAESTKDVKL